HPMRRSIRDRQSRPHLERNGFGKHNQVICANSYAFAQASVAVLAQSSRSSVDLDHWVNQDASAYPVTRNFWTDLPHGAGYVTTRYARHVHRQPWHPAKHEHVQIVQTAGANVNGNLA